MFNAKSQAGSPLVASILMFVLIGCGLLVLFSTFGWPLWQIVSVGLGGALFAAVVNYIAGKRRQPS